MSYAASARISVSDGSLTLVAKNQLVLEKVMEKVFFVSSYCILFTHIFLIEIQDVPFLYGQPSSSRATNIWLCFEILVLC